MFKLYCGSASSVLEHNVLNLGLCLLVVLCHSRIPQLSLVLDRSLDKGDFNDISSGKQRSLCWG